MPLKIVRNDITMMNTEAIVNTANEHPIVGTGCDRAVYQAAGYDQLLRYRAEKIGYVPEGGAFITPGFDLKVKYIIHAVSPLYLGEAQDKEDALRSCYRRSLQIAKEHHIRSIAFPLISTGGYGYPKEEGMRIAVDEINAFLLANDMLVYLVVFGDKATKLGEKIYPDLETYIDQNYVEIASKREYQDVLPRSSEPGNGRPSVTPTFGEACSREIVPESIKEGSTKNGSKTPVWKKLVEKISAPSEAKGSKEKAIGRNEPDNSIEPEYAVDECRAADFLDFEGVHEKKLEERMQHISDTFSEYLMYLIQDKGMENSEVWKRAIVDRKIFSKIKNNVHYHPQKLTALCLCIGAKLNLDEARDLLARAGYALSPCDKTDIIFSYFIENEIYDMIELDIQLEEHGLPCIIS